jgi:hypothetical protein
MRAAKKRFRRERDRRTVNRNFDDKTRISKNTVQQSDEQMRIIVSSIALESGEPIKFRPQYL